LEDTLNIDDEVVQEDEEADVAQKQQASQGSSDDFGDDFDADMVEALDISPQQTPAQTALPARSTSYVTTPTEPVHPPPQYPPAAVHVSRQGSDDDEFGMDDEDDFAADLEQVASLYDTRSVESPTADQAPVSDTKGAAGTASAVSAPVISLLDDDEDEFGEDIDADEFAAAEVAATQAPADTVRRTQTYP
jgi:DNA replication ATP-dependent helicase Dna2